MSISKFRAETAVSTIAEASAFEQQQHPTIISTTKYWDDFESMQVTDMTDNEKPI
jgi:hypothetical protein